MRAVLLLTTLALASCESGQADLGTVRQATTDDGVADAVFGQPDLTTGALPDVVRQSTLTAPVGLGASPTTDSPVVWIPDRDAHRAVGWIPSTSLPSYLAGQNAWTSSEPKSGLFGLRSPYAVAQASGQVVIADTGNHRVLYGYLGGFPWAPAVVFGQLGSFDGATANAGGLSSESLSEPQGVAFDLSFSPRRILVSDTGNHRVLIFTIQSPPATKAIACLGQPDCTSGLPNRGGSPAANTFATPRGLVTWTNPKSPTDPWRGVFVADSANHRVLHYKSLDATADFVFGQGGDFTTAIASKGGPSASSLRDPTAVAVEANGSVWIADTGHHRVLHFPKGTNVADRVLGQPDFTTVAASPEVTAMTLRAPEGVTVASNGDVWVADTGHHRVVRFHKPCIEAECDDGNPCTDDRCDAVTGCAHDLRTFSKECTPYRCDFGALKCQNPCNASSAPCLAPYACESGRCVLRCASDSSCVGSGRKCIDGFCCDRACNGACESCALPGSEGACRTAPAGPPPPSAAGFGTRSCELARGECGAVCDGLDALQCRLTPRGTRCGVEACRDGIAQLGGVCDGTGTCQTGTRPCAPYGCAANGCHDSCVGDHECARDARCVAGACVPTTALHASGGCGFGHSDESERLPLFVLLALLVRRRR